MAEQMDLQIVSAADEEATRQRTEQSTRLQQFISQWDMETIPACDEGMTLLLQFAEAHPTAYQWADQRNFIELTHPMFAKLPKWMAFARHVSTCPKCNER